MNSPRYKSDNVTEELLLIQGLAIGDVTAFNGLYQQYHQSVHQNILRLLKCPERSAEVLQDVFMALWQNRHKFSTEKSVGGWLFVVSYNKSMNVLRQKLKESVAYLEDLPTEIHQDESHIEHEENFQLQLQLLEEAVNELPARKKEVFRLHRYEGKSKEDVASLLGISLQSVNDYLKQSNKLIKRYLLQRHPQHMGKVFFLLILLLS